MIPALLQVANIVNRLNGARLRMAGPWVALGSIDSNESAVLKYTKLVRHRVEKCHECKLLVPSVACPFCHDKNKGGATCLTKNSLQ